jgi:hypothetical protein
VKQITTEQIIIIFILGMFIRDMVIEFKPKETDLPQGKVSQPITKENKQ